MKRKPPKELLDRYKVNVESDTAFKSHARLLQSIWREEKKFLIGTYKKKNQPKGIELGSLLPLGYAESSKMNFLT